MGYLTDPYVHMAPDQWINSDQFTTETKLSTNTDVCMTNFKFTSHVMLISSGYTDMTTTILKINH